VISDGFFFFDQFIDQPIEKKLQPHGASSAHFHPAHFMHDIHDFLRRLVSDQSGVRAEKGRFAFLIHHQEIAAGDGKGGCGHLHIIVGMKRNVHQGARAQVNFFIFQNKAAFSFLHKKKAVLKAAVY